MIARLARRLWRRVAPGLPDGVRRLADPMVRMKGGRPITGLPRVERVAVIAPHPDDESLGCGGTLALLARQGVSVSVCFATDGEAVAQRWTERDEIGRQRRSEALGSCNLLGVSGELRFLGRPNERLAEDLAGLAADIDAFIGETHPDIVMAPWPYDAHPDHRAITGALGLCRLPSSLEVWAYEIWTPLWANRLVDISDVVDVKRAAVELHRADELLDPDLALALNRYRCLSGNMRATHAEAFLALPASAFVALAQ